jgi:peptidoglycan/xylan/chitin deacetylase (PgdA/CDA1 family)
VLVAAAMIAIATAASAASFVPAIGNAPWDSFLATEAPAPVAATTTAPATPAPTLPPSPTPSIDPATAGPAFTSPTPCRPPADIEAARVVSHGDFHKKIVALTFDDGLDPANTKQIVRILKKHKVNATFFPTGSALERFPDLWKSIAKAGFPIANHTYSHIELKGRCFEPQRRELAKAGAAFERLGIEEFPVMRPPYELFDETTRFASSAAGLQAVILWNVDTRDWAGASTSSIRASALRGGKGAIVLMHTFPEATAAALPGIIKGYKKRGFEFVTIGQMLGIAGAVPFPPKESPPAP